MIDWIIRRFAPGADKEMNQLTRGRCGTLGAAVGIAVNVLLASVKLLAGVMTGSVAVTADAVNNLSDAGGSVISLATIRLAQKPVDREHPFGHGRMEYLGALGVGVLILLMGAELLISGVESILHPVKPVFAWLPFALLVMGILLKGWLYLFYTRVGRLIDSASLLAAAKDSLGDMLSTAAVALSMTLSPLTDLPLDGVMGCAVALLVLKAGFDVCRDMVDSLLGGKPDREKGRRIIDMLMRYDGVLGTHDLILHDYGPGRCIASVHAEVPATGDLLELHEMIDRAEREIGEELNIPICIHMDPVVSGDLETDMIAATLTAYLRSRNEGLMLHDLRRVPGVNQTNLIFDVVVPPGYRNCDQLRKDIEGEARRADPANRCVIHFDTDYYHD